MSQDEQDLIRIRTWDAYQEALNAFLTRKQKLAAWGKLLLAVGEKLSNRPLEVAAGDFANAPSSEDFEKGVEEFRASIPVLKRAWIDARGFHFPVDSDVPKQVGGI